MTQINTDIEQLISRKISGDITNAETKQMLDWVAESDENAVLYQKTIQLIAKPQKQQRKSAVWNQVKEKAHLGQLNQKSSFKISKLLKVAAILVFIALIPLALGKYGEDENGIGFVHKVKGNDVVTSFYLPDGSKVFLSRGSEISYSDEYNKSNRELKLKGKAYIEISDKAAHLPMVVNSGKRCAIAKSGKMAIDGKTNHFDVAVEEGQATIVDTVYKKVIIPMFKLTPAMKVGEQSSESIFESTKVASGQRATYSTMDKMAKTKVGTYCEVFSWKDKVFCFSNLKQHELAVKMAEWYGKRVEFKGELNPYKNYSGSFDNPAVNDLVNEVFGKSIKEVKENKRKITVIFS